MTFVHEMAIIGGEGFRTIKLHSSSMGSENDILDHLRGFYDFLGNLVLCFSKHCMAILKGHAHLAIFEIGRPIYAFAQ